MSLDGTFVAVVLPLANHAPDGLGFALLLYFGPVLALVAFLVYLSRRGRGEEDVSWDESGEEYPWDESVERPPGTVDDGSDRGSEAFSEENDPVR